MKILIIHNKYGKHSGEEAMVESVGRVLLNHGHSVEFFYRDSASIIGPLTKIQAIGTSFYAPKTLRAVRSVIERYEPDVVQIQNVFPLISPHVFQAVKEMGVPVVFRCANYRLFCPTGLMLRNGTVCEKCASSTHLNCIRHNCENHSVKSLTYGLRNEYARLQNLIIPYTDAFIVPSEFQKQKFLTWGIIEDRIHVIQNPLPQRFRNPVPRSPLGNYVGYAGRISPEKGVAMIIDVARRNPGVPFKLAGHGSDAYLTSLRLPSNVEHVGMLKPKNLGSFYSNARFMVVPSQWYETFGLVAIEAMRYHKPVIASRIGALQETIIQDYNGILFRHDSLCEFEEAVISLWQDPLKTQLMQDRAANGLEERFGEGIFYRKLLAIYENICKMNSKSDYNL